MISFNSISFYIYVLIFSVVFSFVKSKEKKKFLLFFINSLYLILLFYYRKKHLIFFVVFLVFNYLGLRALQNFKWKKGISTVLILSATLFLGFFKYHVIQSLVLSVFPAFESLLKPLVFLGISFFVFRLISLIVDTLDSDEKIDFFHYFNFLTFFPSFMMGPLDRFERYIGDANSEIVQTNKDHYYPILKRIILGAFKKIVIADTLFQFSLASFNEQDIQSLGLLKVILSHYLYYFVLYFDFSGYCDIAIGVGKLFGINLPENFNHPYKARNIQDFWQRWHITFMEWLKDYLYYPILRILLNINNDFVVTMTCLSFFITFVIAGVWHGDGFNFIVYGIFHGSAFMVWFSYKHFLKKFLGKKKLKSYMSNIYITRASQFITFNYFILSLVWFLDVQEYFINLF